MQLCYVIDPIAYPQNIDHERIAWLRSLDGDRSREVMDLRKIEVLDVVRVIRVQDLLRDESKLVTVR